MFALLGNPLQYLPEIPPMALVFDVTRQAELLVNIVHENCFVHQNNWLGCLVCLQQTAMVSLGEPCRPLGSTNAYPVILRNEPHIHFQHHPLANSLEGKQSRPKRVKGTI